MKITMFSSLLLIAFFFTLSAWKNKPISLSEEVQLVEKILEELVAARGISLPNKMPTVRIDNKGLKEPAAAFLGTNVLQIHPKTIAICKGFGSEYKDALATILGHELVHFYQQHSCYFTHPTDGVDDAIEFEADWQGLFNAYLAGYKIKGASEITLQSSLIDRVYAAFDLKENLPGYPTLQERKKMAQLTETKIKELTMLFETANFAVLRGSFEIAIESYLYLLNSLNAKELHRNLAIAYASLYKQYYEDTYTYPFELNTDFRLYAKVRGDLAHLIIDAIEQSAIRHFCASVENSDELILFEVSLALIRDDLKGAAIKLNDVVLVDYKEKVLVLRKVLTAKSQGINKLPYLETKQTKVPDNCGNAPAYLDEIYPTKKFAKKLKIEFDFDKQITALRYEYKPYEVKRFVVQTYSPSCLKINDLQANYSVKHQQGAFHIYLEESTILTEKNGKIQGAWIWPGFRN